MCVLPPLTADYEVLMKLIQAMMNGLSLFALCAMSRQRSSDTSVPHAINFTYVGVATSTLAQQFYAHGVQLTSILRVVHLLHPAHAFILVPDKQRLPSIDLSDISHEELNHIEEEPCELLLCVSFLTL